MFPILYFSSTLYSISVWHLATGGVLKLETGYSFFNCLSSDKRKVIFDWFYDKTMKHFLIYPVYPWKVFTTETVLVLPLKIMAIKSLLPHIAQSLFTSKRKKKHWAGTVESWRIRPQKETHVNQYRMMIKLQKDYFISPEKQRRHGTLINYQWYTGPNSWFWPAHFICKMFTKLRVSCI